MLNRWAWDYLTGVLRLQIFHMPAHLVGRVNGMKQDKYVNHFANRAGLHVAICHACMVVISFCQPQKIRVVCHDDAGFALGVLPLLWV